MNDNDLEAQLRSQRGPREEGYTPMALPNSLEGEHVPGGGPSPVLRAALFVGAAAAGALAIAVVAGVFSGRSPDVGSGSPSPSEAANACAISDVALSAEPWGGAAGSRGTVVTITLAAGHSSCQLAGPVTVVINDANGTPVISATSDRTGGSVLLEQGAAYTVGIAWSNWCMGPPAAPLGIALSIPGWASPSSIATGGVDDPVPPCNGPGSPSVLSVTTIEPKQS